MVRQRSDLGMDQAAGAEELLPPSLSSSSLLSSAKKSIGALAPLRVAKKLT